MLEIITGLLTTLGPKVTVSLAGIYLVVAAIVGEFIPKKIRINSAFKRMLLASLGIVLSSPLIVMLYIDLFTKATVTFSSPHINSEVAEEEPTDTSQPGSARVPSPDKPMQTSFESVAYGSLLISRLPPRPFTHSQVGATQSKRTDCKFVESFGLEQETIRRLQHKSFRNQVQVYVGNIRYDEPFEVRLILKEGWETPAKMTEAAFQKQIAEFDSTKIVTLTVKRAGDAIPFTFYGKTYELKVTKIFAVVFGKDKVAIRICELPREATAKSTKD